jgi:hypothetical protein
VSGSLRTTSPPHWSSASHPTGHIFAEGHEALNEITNVRGDGVAVAVLGIARLHNLARASLVRHSSRS